MGLFDKIKDFIDQRRGYEQDADYEDEEDGGESQEVGGVTPEDVDDPPRYVFLKALHAASLGDVATIRDYLNFNPAYAQCHDWDDNTLLHRAAEYAQAEIVELLLQHQADPNRLYKDHPPLHCSIGTTPAWVKTKKPSMSYAQHQQARLNTMAALLKQGANLNAVNDKGENPLHFAVRLGHGELAAFMLKQGADVNARTQVEGAPDSPFNGRTPLLQVARYTKNKKLMQFLLEQGADPNAQDQTPGYTTLHYLAASPLQEDIEKEKALAELAVLLLKYKANPNLKATHKQNQSPLHLAAANNHALLTEALLKGGADVNQQADKGMTAIGIAAKQGALEMVECLLKYGVDMQSTRALFFAAMCKKTTAIMELLISKGADINQPDEHQLTPIFSAIAANSYENVKFLMDKGIDTRLHPPGRTVLQHAFANWGAIEAIPEEKRDQVMAENAKNIIEALGGFDSLKKKTRL